MKKGLFTLALGLMAFAINAQSIVDANDGRNYNDFYQKGIVVGKRAMPYPFLRESDVVWETTIWRVIDMNENFNQFMYFPLETENDTQGRTSLINLIVNACKNGEIEMFDSDDLEVPIDWEKANRQISGAPRTEQREKTNPDGTPAYDEDGELEYEDVIIQPEFDLPAVKRVQLKEYWYIDKQDTRQKVRITGLTFEVTTSTKAGDIKDWAFWVPMDDMRVRQVLVNADAFDENNIVAEKSYDDIFIQRYFDSYVIRESNKYNRAITSYLTGVDAIYESRRIEDMIFNIESDMWEY